MFSCLSKGEQNGYNIPEVTAAPQVSKWFADSDAHLLDHSLLENGNLSSGQFGSDQVKRLVCDAYMCFYQSTEVMMYQ